MVPKHLLDSTYLIGDSNALISRISEDGYIFIRNLIPRNRVLNVRRNLLIKLQACNCMLEDTNFLDGIANPNFDSLNIRSDFKDIIKHLWCDEDLHALRTDDNVKLIFEKILKSKVLVHPKFALRVFFPNNLPTKPHQDKVHVGGGDFFTMWAPLGDYESHEGVLAIAKNSHKNGLYATEFAGMGVKEEFLDNWYTSNFKAGDVVIFSDKIVHKSLPNQSKRIRLSFDARYQSEQTPIADINLMPAHDTLSDNWNEVYKGWKSKEGQYYWKSNELNIVEFDRTHYEIEYPGIFRKAVNGDDHMKEALLRFI